MYNADFDEKEIDNVYDNDYFKLSKQLQLFVGLWPYKKGLKSRIRRYIVFFDVMISFYPVINGFRIWCGKDLDICCENILGIIYLTIVFCKFQVTLLSENKLKNLYNKLALTWLTTKDPEEKAIMEEYAKMGYFKAKAYLTGIGFCQLPMIPIVLDIVHPLNTSREKILFVKSEFIFDPFDYYYEIYVYYILSTVITVSAYCCVDCTYTTVTHQNFGILSVVRHRLKVATQLFDEKSNSDYDKIIQTISLHREALKFIELIETSYSFLFLWLIGGSVLFMSMGAIIGMSNLYNEIYSNLARLALGMIGCLVHMLYLSWPGQMLIDHSEEIFLSIYTNEWYNISKKSKILLRIIMLKCFKPCTFTAGGLYIMCFENFGAVVKTALTYITAAISFRN